MASSPSTLRRLRALQPAIFEQLANHVLWVHPPYESLIPTGLNERGRPVPAPVDAFCWIPGTSPPQGVLFAYTATDRRKLREKWLFDPARAPRRKTRPPEGDVIKALRRAEGIRREIPQAALTLVLASTVDPPEELTTTVKARCLKAGVEVDFWTVARLVHFLDHDPRGQWLRQEFLRIPPRFVSRELLQELTEKSCRSYAASIFEDPTAPHIERELDHRLWKEVHKTSRGVRFLVTESGFGKSSAALALLRRHWAAGGCGLWLTPEDIVEGISIEGAVEAALRRLQPELLPGCGAEGLKIASGSQGLLLVADDLSRAAAPPSLLLRIASWAGRQERSEEGHRESARGWFLLCPIWPRFLSELPETAREPVQALCLHGGPYSPEEGAAVLQARSRCCGEALTEIEARRLSESLGHDPLLLSLLDLRRKEPWEEHGNRPVSLQVVEDFLERHFSQLAARPEQHFLASDYEDALLDLADRMVVERELAPTWREIRSWFRFSADVLDAMHQISTDRKIAHFLREGGEEVLHFRHDRVRDSILGSALARSMKNGALPEAVLLDPFYAELLGQALLTPGVEPVWVNRLREHNPLALFRALQLFQTPRGPLQEAIAAAMRVWLADEVASSRALDALRWEAARILAETDSPLVLEFSRSFPDTWHGILEARFRNGEVAAAVTYCASMGLGVPYSGFVPLLEHVQARFGSSFVRGLASVLNQRDLPRDQLRGALVLAGHLAEPFLAPAVRSAWKGAAKHRIALFAKFLWAALRCLPKSEDEANRLLGPLFKAWRTLPAKSPDQSRAPENTEVITPLQDAIFRRGLGEQAISALIRRAIGRLEWPITVLLNRVDSPEAVEFTVRQAAAIPGYWGYTRAWERWDVHGRRLGAASIGRLEELWRSPSEMADVRRKAFDFWSIASEGTDIDDLNRLRDVGPSEPFYHAALRCRIRLGDQTAVTELIRMTETDEFPHFWWQDAHRIWNEKLRDALDSFLGRLPEDGRAGDWEWEGHHFCAAEVLVEIPAADAEALLLRHWKHLRYRRLFVQAALAVATPRCCELVAAAVRDCPDPQRLLEYFEYHCGLQTVGRGQQFGDRQLEAILPYLDLLSDHTLESLWWHCNEKRWFNYRRCHLDPRLTANQGRNCGFGREALYEKFDRYLGDKWSPWSIDHQIELSNKRGESWDDLLETLLAWLRERRTLKALEIVAHAIIWAGRRADLARVAEIEIDADPVDVRRILDRTDFQVSRRRLR
jgi:hypothetical protein